MPTPRTIIATLLACALVALSSSRSTHLQVLAQEAAVPAGATPSATPAVDPRVEKYKRDAAADIDGMKDFTQQMVDQVFSYGELAFQEVETSKIPDRHPREERVSHRARLCRAFRRRGWRRGARASRSSPSGSDIDCIPQASQKPGVAYHDPVLPGAPGPRRGAQLRCSAQHHGRAGGEEDHGARTPRRHDQALAGSCRGGRRRQSVLHPRRPVQGRRHLALRARRRELRHLVGRERRHRPRIGRIHVHRARARMPPRIRGAAVRRSMPSN